ncbi:MAG: hypothetical protein AAB522_03285, partial [Patescibacteria group bacterium]
KLQIGRLENLFNAGFELPKNLCRKYQERFLMEYDREDNAKSAEIYNFLFSQFWEEIKKQIILPETLNNLDKITLFGDVCLGNYS